MPDAVHVLSIAVTDQYIQLTVTQKCRNW